MDERVMQFRVGVMLLATLIITAILVLIFGRIPIVMGSSYRVMVRFPQVRGVSDGTAVRKSGVLIGRVTAVGNPDLLTGDVVEVTVKIDGDKKLFPEEQCRIMYSALGDAQLEFYLPPGAVRTAPVPHDPPHLFEGQMSLEPLELATQALTNLRGVSASVSKTSDSIGELARKVNGILDGNKGKLRTIVDQADDTLKAIKKTMESADQLIGDPEVRGPLKQALKQAPALVDETRSTFRHMEQTLSRVDENLANLSKFTQALGDRGPATMDHVDAVVKNMDAIMVQLEKFSISLNSSEGTLGQIIHNPELYDHLNRTVTNVDQIIRDLRPIVADARTFTDKIARHPEVLGVRGAIKPSPGIK